MKHEVRYASSPEEVKKFDTDKIRDKFLIDKLMKDNEIYWVYSHYDRFMIGSAVPVKKKLDLKSIYPLKSSFFLERREMGMINIGDTGVVLVDGTEFILSKFDALYVGKGAKDISFASKDPSKPAKFYLNSSPAHREYPVKKVTLDQARKLELGTEETSNQRVVNQILVSGVVDTCQLQMGMTELKTGSIWNTMPAHVHDRRMEVYFYLNVPKDQSVCHFMGQTEETRHIWIQNEQAVVSPPWSIHSGAGTSSYAFIWGMAGENLDYGDMDVCKITDLR